MKNFHCDVCDNLVYFENVRCEPCGHELAFVPSLCTVTAITVRDQGLWLRALPAGQTPAASAPRYRKCRNYEQKGACNWALDADDPNPYCVSCRLTETIPDLSQPGNAEAWIKLETGKRRLIYSLLELRLPLQRKTATSAGLLFRFMADDPRAPGPEGKVLTGHDEGAIVINVAEADDAERERRRQQMHEPYRTLLGHLRHEIGHYYWDVLIRDSNRIEAYRGLFGDERADYAASLKRHYDTGGPADWRNGFVSVYATSHPWEDWAETWAHYMHISDTLETADSSGFSLRPRHQNEPTLKPVAAPQNPAARNFDEMIERWLSLTYVLNNLNRGLGLGDAYPFVLSAPALDKLRFVHETICPVQ